MNGTILTVGWRCVGLFLLALVEGSMSKFQVKLGRHWSDYETLGTAWVCNECNRVCNECNWFLPMLSPKFQYQSHKCGWFALRSKEDKKLKTAYMSGQRTARFNMSGISKFGSETTFEFWETLNLSLSHQGSSMARRTQLPILNSWWFKSLHTWNSQLVKLQ